MKTIPSTITSLSKQYDVSLPTFQKMLADFPELKLPERRRVLTPLEVEKIYKCLGEPEEFQKPK